MDAKTIIEKSQLDLYVKDIFVLENTDPDKKSLLPFFADGLIGLMYSETTNGVTMMPLNKKLGNFILYGQTLEPIHLNINGKYKLIVFQLFPSAAKALFGLKIKALTNQCYDLTEHSDSQLKKTRLKIQSFTNTELQVNTIAKMLQNLASKNSRKSEKLIQAGVDLVLIRQGKITVSALSGELGLSERSLQRHFSEHIGITPKQFIKVIRFRNSFDQLDAGVFSKFTDLVYENGYADQSHFIRNIKKFTHKKPSQFKSK